MRKSMVIIIFLLSISIIGCSKKGTQELAKIQKEMSTVISFENDLLPVFQRSCSVCHNRQNQNSPATEHNAFYENVDDIMTKIGSYIIVGNPDESGLYKICSQSMTVSDENIVMPPPGSGIPKWTDQDLEKFAKWIAAGALRN